MSISLASYTKILDLLHELEANDYFLNHIRVPKLTDDQLIALNFLVESLVIDSERYLFKRLPLPLLGKIERAVCLQPEKA